MRGLGHGLVASKVDGPDFIALAGLAAMARSSHVGTDLGREGLMSDEIKPGMVLEALARIEASMAVFTTELATVITRLELLQSSLDAIREELDQEEL